MHKQNHPPMKKQGLFYQIPLGKNQGPFLSKDIMHNNQKSISLLTSSEVLKSHKSMLNITSYFQNKNNLSNDTRSKNMKIQNFECDTKYLEGELLMLSKNSQQLKMEQKKLKRQIYFMQALFNEKTSDLLQESMPVLKKLAKKIKQLANQQNRRYYAMTKQIESISKDRQVMAEGVLQCIQKIKNLENIFGNQEEKSS